MIGIILVLLILPVLSIAACSIKDSNRKRRKIFNLLLISNGAVYSLPLILFLITGNINTHLYLDTFSLDQIINLFSALLPICIVVFVVLLLLKIANIPKKLEKF